MAAGGSSERSSQDTGPHSDHGVTLILGLMVGIILLLVIVNQGHNTVNQGANVPAGAYSSALPADGVLPANSAGPGR